MAQSRTRRKQGFWHDLPARAIAMMASVFAFLVGMITTSIVIDERYAHATNVNEKFDELKSAQTTSIERLRKQQIEDRVFELNMKGAAQTDFDRALIQRYRQQLEETNRNIDMQQRSLPAQRQQR